MNKFNCTCNTCNTQVVLKVETRRDGFDGVYYLMFWDKDNNGEHMPCVMEACEDMDDPDDIQPFTPHEINCYVFIGAHTDTWYCPKCDAEVEATVYYHDGLKRTMDNGSDNGDTLIKKIIYNGFFPMLNFDDFFYPIDNSP